MNLPFMLGEGFLNQFVGPTMWSLALGLAVVGTVGYFWWVRHMSGDQEYRSFRATRPGGASQVVVALGVTLSAGAALIFIAPMIARLIPA